MTFVELCRRMALLALAGGLGIVAVEGALWLNKTGKWLLGGQVVGVVVFWAGSIYVARSAVAARVKENERWADCLPTLLKFQELQMREAGNRNAGSPGAASMPAVDKEAAPDAAIKVTAWAAFEQDCKREMEMRERQQAAMLKLAAAQAEALRKVREQQEARQMMAQELQRQFEQATMKATAPAVSAADMVRELGEAVKLLELWLNPTKLPCCDSCRATELRMRTAAFLEELKF